MNWQTNPALNGHDDDDDGDDDDGGDDDGDLEECATLEVWRHDVLKMCCTLWSQVGRSRNS